LLEVPSLVVAACDRAIELARQERQDTDELRRLRDAAQRKML
jgi:hypothetical protein